MFPVFSLTLMVNHACNLRCTYCYTGAKFRRPMSDDVAVAAISRAVTSTLASGRLDVGLFGGEPLFEASAILNWSQTTRDQCSSRQVELHLNLTTNGTIADDAA